MTSHSIYMRDISKHLGQLAAKLVLKLESIVVRLTCCCRLIGLILLPTHYLLDCAELCQDFEAETGRVETGLDPINCPVKDDVAMNVLRLESLVYRMILCFFLLLRTTSPTCGIASSIRVDIIRVMHQIRVQNGRGHHPG